MHPHPTDPADETLHHTWLLAKEEAGGGGRQVR